MWFLGEIAANDLIVATSWQWHHHKGWHRVLPADDCVTFDSEPLGLSDFNTFYVTSKSVACWWTGRNSHSHLALELSRLYGYCNLQMIKSSTAVCMHLCNVHRTRRPDDRRLHDRTSWSSWPWETSWLTCALRKFHSFPVKYRIIYKLCLLMRLSHSSQTADTFSLSLSIQQQHIVTSQSRERSANVN